MSKLKRAVGMMSGTSMDGIDVALIETDGEGSVARRATYSRPYSASERDTLAAAMVEASLLSDRSARPGTLANVERQLTELHAAALQDFVMANGIDRDGIDVVGFHGQTVLHRPEVGLTVQLGDGPLLAQLTKLPVVYDMRAADVAAGGQGAPLASAYHRAFAAGIKERPVAILNIGGVANLTWIGPRNAAEIGPRNAAGIGPHSEHGEEDILAFDTGPGNALMDDWVSHHTGEPFDRDGALARAGMADVDRLATYLKHPYLQQTPPKSLDRYDFTLRPLDGLNAADGAATLAQVTVVAIVRSTALLPVPPLKWIVCGGGRHNTFLMEQLRRHLGAPVIPAEDIGLDGDSVEAEAWAYLAVRAMKGLPLTFPGTTGVREPLTGGVISLPTP